MAFLEIKNLQKRYGRVDVLKGIDLDLEKGGFLVLVGPSGCGKSTLLNAIAGLETITGGDILIDGAVVNDLRPSKRDIAMVFQSYALYPNMTVAQNMAFGMEMRGVAKPEREAAVQRVAKLLQMPHLLDRKPSQLSGGQRQRVAMGRALVRDPKLFLFDEPLSNLDAKLRVDMRTEIKKLHQATGTTIAPPVIRPCSPAHSTAAPRRINAAPCGWVTIRQVPHWMNSAARMITAIFLSWMRRFCRPRRRSIRR